MRLRSRPSTMWSMIRLPPAPIASLIIGGPPRLGDANQRRSATIANARGHCQLEQQMRIPSAAVIYQRPIFHRLLGVGIVDCFVFDYFETPFASRRRDLDLVSLGAAHQPAPDR